MYLQTILLTLFLADRIYAISYDGASCKEIHCSCCKNGECSPNQTCNGCIDGFSGPKCDKPCPGSCINCSQDFYNSSNGVCYTCIDGYYNGYSNDTESFPVQLNCTLICKENCTKCTAFHNCSECDNGFYLIGGKCMKCLSGCFSCSENFTCNKCKTGFFLVDSQCSQCPKYCTKCNLDEQNQLVCYSCSDEYFSLYGSCQPCGSYCSQCDSKTCYSCKPPYKLNNGSCYRCPKTCDICSSHDHCIQCRSGFFIANGGCFPCLEKCASCSNQTQCSTCNEGYFGYNCSKSCPKNCKNLQCDILWGKCIECTKDYFFNDDRNCTKCPNRCIRCNSNECLECRNGYTGNLCQNKCTHCKQGTSCHILTGTCLKDCEDGWSGEDCISSCDYTCSSCERNNAKKCIKCAVNRHGESCLYLCPSTCFNGTCEEKSGKCSGCLRGHWGETCNKICSEDCRSSGCDQTNGTCSNHSAKETTAEAAAAVTVLILICVTAGVLCALFRQRLARYLPESCVHTLKKRGCLKGMHERDDRSVNDRPELTEGDSRSTTHSGANSMSSQSTKKYEPERDRLITDNDRPELTDGDTRSTQGPVVDKGDGASSSSSSVESGISNAVQETLYKEDNERVSLPYKGRPEEKFNDSLEMLPVVNTRRIAVVSLPISLKNRDIKGEYQTLLEFPVQRSQKDASNVLDFTRIEFQGAINKTYIISLGPRASDEENTSIFWNMVLEKNCAKIAMLTCPSINEVSADSQYLPNRMRQYGNISVYIEDTIESNDHYTQTKLVIIRESNLERRSQSEEEISVMHHCFLDWLDNGNPNDISVFVNFWKDVWRKENKYKSIDVAREKDRPTWVHCRDDVGHTGVFLALDILNEQAQKEGYVDVFECVKHLREQCPAMFTTEEQYIEVYKILEMLNKVS